MLTSNPSKVNKARLISDSVNPDIIFGTGTWVDDKIIEMVEEPTRESNTLDLIVTNYPNSFIRVETIPGISDDDILFADLKTIPSKQTQKPRKISLYKKAKWDNIKEDLKSINEEITKMNHHDCCTQDMWDYFQNKLENTINTNIPQKTARSKDGNPWITADIKRLIRKRDKHYKRKINQLIQSTTANTRN
ncbi:unnamed protein product [Mytilus edulis]|uniref:Uncharacterized protein n=1 Tax=Mytilus edulis TaxID=6550 RepID=A0A8S3UJH5_MYTED|nr:unnamed protein product [Mytilus edulis]